MKVLDLTKFRSRLFSAALLTCCLPLILLLAGCGNTTTASGSGTTIAPTVALTATPDSVSAGASSVLNVTAANAIKVVITGSDGSTYSLPGAGGSQSITPSATVTYTATATGGAGTTPATASVKVTVTAAAAATVTISANPTSIAPGASSTLTVVATNATAVTISGSDSTTFTLAVTGGTQTVKPTATTTYTVSAVGVTGSAPVTAQAVVTVTSAVIAPTITILANPTSIAPSGTSTLTVSATNATSVVVTGSDSSHYALTSTGGTQTVSPTATTTYTATATGPGGTASSTVTVTVTAAQNTTVTITSNQSSIIVGSSAVLTVSATNATGVTLTGNDNTTYTVSNTGGSQTVSPTATTIYTATASGATGTPVSASVTVTVLPAATLQSVKHVVMMLQENHTFDNYFGMLNPYRITNNMNIGADGKNYAVDGIDDKLNIISNQDDEGDAPFSLFKFKSTCIDDLTSAWLESYGDVSRYDFSTTRSLPMDGFVHTAEGFAKYCASTGANGRCAGAFNDLQGKRSMGYYDENFLNYYYYMASEFALSDRWFSPVSSKSISNRLATYTGGTTQGLVSDPGNDDNLPQLGIKTFFSELSANRVSWKIYYTSTDGGCLYNGDCSAHGKSPFPSTDFTYFSEANQYLTKKTNLNPTCPAGLSDSVSVGDSSNSFCIDTTHVAPLSQYFTDVTAGTLPSFAFIEAGYGINDEHPGSGNSVLNGQIQVAKVVNSLMTSPSWKDSALFLAYDEGGGPYDHVPPVPGHSNMYTDAMVGSTPVGSIPDIAAIAVDADGPSHPYKPCVPSGVPTIHCDLSSLSPGAKSTDAAAVDGFTAQLGFRVPNMIISPFIRKHYVGHIPMDHTAILKFVEDAFLPGTSHFTPRVAAQPDLLDFFDFNAVPWATPPSTPIPYNDNGAACTPTSF